MRAKSHRTFMRKSSKLEWLAPSWRSFIWPWQKSYMYMYRSKEHSLGRVESSEHGSMNFCAFRLSTITDFEYSNSCRRVLTSMKALPKGINLAMWGLCEPLKVLYSDVGAYSCQVCLSMHFLIELDGFGQIELSRADYVDLRSVVPTL